jgi:hypothetical protein
MLEAQLKLQSSTLGIKDANTNLDLVGLAAELFAAGVKFGVKEIQSLACGTVRSLMWSWEHLNDPAWSKDRYCGMVLKIYNTTPEFAPASRYTVLEDSLLELYCADDDGNDDDGTDEIDETNAEGVDAKCALADIYSKLMQAVRANHDLAFDVSTGCLSGEWKCSKCKEVSQTRIRLCECNKISSACKWDTCIDNYVRSSICWSCHTEGTMAPDGFWDKKMASTVTGA